MKKEEVGWGGWIRTTAWRDQNPLPYRLATPQYQVLGHCAGQTFFLKLFNICCVVLLAGIFFSCVLTG
jgi:hypothetical protein